MQLTVFSEKELFCAAQKITEAFPKERVFCFYGEMGAGKTTFIKEICRFLGVENTTSSPTFAIVNEYFTNTGEPVYHFDFYRVEHLRDVYEIGVEDYLYSGHYCFIEWAEKLGPLVRPEFLKVHISTGENGQRIIEICK